MTTVSERNQLYLYFLSVDPVPILNELKRIGVIKLLEYEQLSHFPKKTLYTCLFEILIKRQINMSAILFILRKTGNDVLFSKLQKLFQSSRSNVSKLHRAESGINDKVHYYFNDMKVNFLKANDAYKNPLAVLRKETESINRVLEITRNHTLRQMFIDKKIALLLNVLDACLIIFHSDQEVIANLFDELNILISDSTNECLSEVVFYSRMGLRMDMLYYAGPTKLSEDDGEDCFMKAHTCATASTPCLEMATLFFFHLHHELWRFGVDPTQELKQSVLDLGHISLECLQQENEFTQNMWKSFVCVKCASCLLGISNNLHIINNYTPDAEDIHKARQYLQIFDDCRDSTYSLRRVEMWYNLARVRLYDLTGETLTSFLYAKDALKIAREGSFREVEAVRTFYSDIEQKHESEIRASFCIDVNSSHFLETTKVPVGHAETYDGLCINATQMMDDSYRCVSPKVPVDSCSDNNSSETKMVMCTECICSYVRDVDSTRKPVPLWSTKHNHIFVCDICGRFNADSLMPSAQKSSDDVTMYECDIEMLFGKGKFAKRQKSVSNLDSLMAGGSSELSSLENRLSCPGREIDSVVLNFGRFTDADEYMLFGPNDVDVHERALFYSNVLENGTYCLSDHSMMFNTMDCDSVLSSRGYPDGSSMPD